MDITTRCTYERFIPRKEDHGIKCWRRKKKPIKFFTGALNDAKCTNLGKYLHVIVETFSATKRRLIVKKCEKWFLIVDICDVSNFPRCSLETNRCSNRLDKRYGDFAASISMVASTKD